MSFNERFQVSAPCRYSYTSTQRANLTYDNTRISKERLLKHLRLRHLKTDEFVPIKTEKEQISLGRKITVATIFATIFAIAGDLIFCKGKHIKSILSNLKCNKSTPKITAEVKPKVIPEVKTEVKPVAKLEVKPEIETEVKPVTKLEVKPEIETEIKPEVKPESKTVVKLENPAINEAKLKAEKDLELLSKEIPSMSRSSIAQQRVELNGFGSEIHMLEIKGNKEGLSELENIRLDFLKRKLSLLEEREKQIAQSLQKYIPTTSDNSAVSMHHYINGENPRFRDAISSKSKKPGELSEGQIKNLERMEKRMAQIDKEFEQLPPLEKDCIVYRGRAENPVLKNTNVDFAIMEKANVGDVVIPDSGYSYTAFNYDTANIWCHSGRMTDINNNPLRTIMYEIHLPKGAKVSRNLEHGGEVVMPRGAQYKVLDKKVASNGDIEVVLEYILPKAQ